MDQQAEGALRMALGVAVEAGAKALAGPLAAEVGRQTRAAVLEAMKGPLQPFLLTSPQAAAFLNVKRASFRALVREGKIIPADLGVDGRDRFLREDLEAYARGRKAQEARP